MLPSERGDMGEEIVADSLASRTQLIDGEGSGIGCRRAISRQSDATKNFRLRSKFRRSASIRGKLAFNISEADRK